MRERYFDDPWRHEAPDWKELRVSRQVARKGHRCDECRFLFSRTINPGEPYIKRVGVSDGSMVTTRRCEKCPAIKCPDCDGRGAEGEHGYGSLCRRCGGDGLVLPPETSELDEREAVVPRAAALPGMTK